MGKITLALGSNLAGRWGAPTATIAIALYKLESRGLVVYRKSDFVVSEPVGLPPQSRFVNMVVTGAIGEPPAKLLRLLKDLERAAGRRVAADRVAGRPLDIDIIDYRGHRSLRPAPRGRRRPGQVILPHPEAHRRAFVLAPLAQVAGYGLSSTFGGGVRHLLVKQRAPRHALRRLDSSAVV